jgi:hypothetical protein
MDDFFIVPLFQETTKMCIYIIYIYVKQALAHLSGGYFFRYDPSIFFDPFWVHPAGWWPVA